MYIIYINNKNYHTNTLPAFIYLLKLEIQTALLRVASVHSRYDTLQRDILTPTKPSCFHRFFNIGLLPERLWSCSFGF